VDRVGGVGHEDDVAGRGDGLGEVSEAFLGTERDDDFFVGIDRHSEAALIVGCLRFPEARDSAAGGVAVGSGLGRDFSELRDDVRRRRAVWIAHAEVDDVLPAPARRGLHRVDLGEDVGRQALDSVEVGVHRHPCGGEPRLLQCTMFARPELVEGRFTALVPAPFDFGLWPPLRTSGDYRGSSA